MEVGAPFGPGWKPLLASAISLPSISTGPRTYFVTPSAPQVAIGASLRSGTPSRAPGCVQSRATYSLATLAAASSALAFSQPIDTRPALTCVFTAASVSAAEGAVAVGAGVAGVVAEALPV